VLQGEKVVNPPSQESKSTGSEASHSGKHKVKETMKRLEVLTKKLEASLSSQLGPQANSQLEAFPKQGHNVPPSSPTTPVGTSNTT
jgi:hypothetical protein